MSAGDRDTLTDHANHRGYVPDCEPCLERLNAVYRAQDHFNKHDIDGLCDWITHHVDSDGAFEYGFYAGERWAAARVRAAQAQAWDEGNEACCWPAYSHNNPYRLDAGDEFQNPED